ncbi:hypothetical protein NM688_g1756 [Phlebia brevispora]|uniref:Uncharacterized protein n=1 Tax=Phlebia brevispora TaxID=194682 RepID=A0ACC1TAE5_9APHY|nr:hypothetical protein NM688_g1756 [Phlebia brevispora]
MIISRPEKLKHFDSACFMFEEAPRSDGTAGQHDHVRFIATEEGLSEDEDSSPVDMLHLSGNNRPRVWSDARFSLPYYAAIFLFRLGAVNFLFLADSNHMHSISHLVSSIANDCMSWAASLPSVVVRRIAGAADTAVTSENQPFSHTKRDEPSSSSSLQDPISLDVDTRIAHLVGDAAFDLEMRVADLADHLSLDLEKCLSEIYDKLSTSLDAHIKMELNARQHSPTPAQLTCDFTLEADERSILCSLMSYCHFWTPNSWSTTCLTINDNSQISQCWLLPTRMGQIALILQVPIYPTSVTIDHIPRTLAADLGQAPHHMILWGVVDGTSNQECIWELRALINAGSDIPDSHLGPPYPSNFMYTPLAVFEYDINADVPTQTFPVLGMYSGALMDFAVVVLEVMSNWSSESTCLYCVRVHGEEIAESSPASNTTSNMNADADVSKDYDTVPVAGRKQLQGGRDTHDLNNTKSQKVDQTTTLRPLVLKEKPTYKVHIRREPTELAIAEQKTQE